MPINNSINNTSYGITVLGTANINAAAADAATTIGNSTGASPLVLIGGTSGISLASTSTGDITIASSDQLLLDSAGVLELNSSGGVISIGNDAVAQNINIGTGAAARTITVGNVTGASALVLNSGTGGIALASTSTGDITVNSADTVLIDSAGVLELNSSGDAINIGNDAVAQAINIGTGAAARTITIGNATGASGVVLTSGSAGITLTGFAAGSLVTDSSGVASSVNGTAGFVLTSNGAGNAPSFQAASSGSLSWTDVTGTSQSMAVNNGYTANNAALVTFTLPATAAYGSIIEVAGKGAGGWAIAQNSGQTIHFGSVNTTTGTGGSLASTLQYDTIRLLCTVANNDFTVLSSVGNITYV